jgi:hypothetical protein
MLYESPELFEAAFSLLRCQYFCREPVVAALQDVMLLETTDLFEPPHLLTVYWEDDTQPKGSTDAACLCEVQHVKHLQSFRQLLRRGIESYELWGIVSRDRPEGNRTWYLNILGYLLLFIKFPLKDGNLHLNMTGDMKLVAGEVVDEIDDFHIDDLSFEYDEAQNGEHGRGVGYDKTKTSVNLEHQEIMRGLGVHTVLLQVRVCASVFVRPCLCVRVCASVVVKCVRGCARVCAGCAGGELCSHQPPTTPTGG